MRKVLLSAALLALGGCTTTSLWDKAGADQATLNLDLGKCRHDAQQEAMRLYGAERSYPFYDRQSFNGGWPPVSSALRRAVDDDQARAEKALAASCMRRKGYGPTPL